ncbi:hypothetical protein PRNP1_007514 [Phytophthora ramorum]
MTATVAKSCLSCGKSDAKNRCGGCRRVFFCDRDCQRLSWPSHRPECLQTPKPVEAQHIPANSIQCVDIPGAAAAPVATSPPKSVRLVTEPVQVVEIPAEPEQQQPKPQKKSKKHKKKRKARSNSMHVASTSAPLAHMLQRKNRSASLGGKKHIMWGDVTAREFARFPGGGSAVPYDGTWALGLGKKLADVELGSVLEVEQLREQQLQERAKKLSKTKRRDVRVGETRQFDYQRGVDNPLFSRLSEDERKRVFSLEKQAQEDDAIQMSSSPEMKKSWRKYSTGSTSSLEAVEELQVADAALTTPDFGCVSIEQLDEFAKIRDSRDDACGCSCGDLVKKVAKMNVKKLRVFLQEHNVPLPGTGKAELMAAAKKVAREKKNCQSADTDCECARNGVPCHSDACEGCAGDCHNPFQRYVYKSAEVKQYRKQQLAKWRQLQGDLQQSSEAAAPIRVA